MTKQRIRERKQSRNGGHTKETADDKLTRKWLAALRNPNNTQAVGRWRGANDPLFTPDWDPYTEDWNAKCGVGHLLDAHNPKGWRYGGGKKHASYRDMEQRYGKHLLNRVIRMNDSGMSLPEQADYIEKHLRHRKD